MTMQSRAWPLFADLFRVVISNEFTKVCVGRTQPILSNVEEPSPRAPVIVSKPTPYQFIFIANWNCRGSYAAVGCPALLNSGLTADTFILLAMLNMSTIRSVLIRSVK